MQSFLKKMASTIRSVVFFLGSLSLFWTATASELTFDALFNEGAVLQAEMSVNVWGRSGPGETVTVGLGDIAVSVQAEADGRWLLQLPPMPHSSDPQTLTASAGNQTVAVKDVLVGEVWLASGQSNMVWALNQTEGGVEMAAQTLPTLRFVRVPLRSGPPFGTEFSSSELAWTPFIHPRNLGFSAVATHFAVLLQERLGVPIGIIQSAQGATPAEAWTPVSVFHAHSNLQHYAKRRQKGLAMEKPREEWMKEINDFDAAHRAWRNWQQTREGDRPPAAVPISPENPYHIRFPSGLYENMIVPLQPYTFRGVIWYQGEGNAANPTEYRTLFPAMIASWREAWKQSEWPFLFVQLSAYDHPSADWPGLRAAQAFTRDTVPHTGMALSIDCGEAKDIHPRRKQPVGERLARLALGQVYSQDLPTRGPLATRVEVGPESLTVFFDHVNDGLQVDGGQIQSVEFVDAAGEIHPVSARLAGPDRIEVLVDSRKEQIAELRYAWRNWMERSPNLYNKSGLPAEPFLLQFNIND
jgi:sialate O-acetylesterase